MRGVEVAMLSQGRFALGRGAAHGLMGHAGMEGVAGIMNPRLFAQLHQHLVRLP